MQEAGRSSQDQHVVMVSRAPQKCTGVLHGVADLEAKTFDEEGLGDCEIGGTQHCVSELSRTNGSGSKYARGTLPLTFKPSRTVVGGRRDRLLNQTRCHYHRDLDTGGLLHGGYAMFCGLRGDPDATKALGDSIDVVVVVGGPV